MQDRRTVSSNAFLRLILVYLAEALAVACSGYGAFLLRFDFRLPRGYVGPFLVALAAWIPLKLIAFRVMGLDRRWARYVSISDLLRLVSGNVAASAVATAMLIASRSHVPRSVYAIDLLITLCVTGGMRVCVRLVAESARYRSPRERLVRAFIYGAGDAGTALLRDVRQNSALHYEICGFIDDDPRKQGLILHGVRVVASGAELAAATQKFVVELVLIAIPSSTGEQMKSILEKCAAAGVRSKTVPGLAELIMGNGLARQIRDVAVEDLLGRSPVRLDDEKISAQLRDRVVMVTGAAGSIGSEICRQVARFAPAAIVGFEIAESPLFALQNELARAFPEILFHAEIGSIQNVARLEEVLAKHKPSTVFHAAAYKHVPLMESHIVEAVENNVFGTLNTVRAAHKFGVREFVLISSDKAVRPANVMGATKRIAELVVRSYQTGDGAYVSVRFGNVLGSNGSVVPIFKEQIARGGPVTVTDPEMRRFFMTIPEACQLVLQASTMGRGNEIFVLDMGKPVRIVDLARNLILLSGLRPDVDVRIEFTGTRPGEKLYEELSEAAEGLVKTHHQKIQVFEGAAQPWEEIERHIERLGACCKARNHEDLTAAICRLVPEYTPSAELRSAARSKTLHA